MQRHLSLLLVFCLVLSLPVQAQNPATVLAVGAERQGTQVMVEIKMSTAVRPALSTAVNPDRIIIDLPNATPSSDLRKVAVNAGGVREVRIGLNSSTPAVTRVVIDLQQPQTYHVTFDGSRILLSVEAPIVAHAKSTDGARPAGESGGLAGLFRREKKPAPSDSRPSSAHPNFGSLQQGVINPGAGEPGTGNVPDNSGPKTFDTVAAASPSSRPAGEAAAAGSFPSPAPESVPETAIVSRGEIKPFPSPQKERASAVAERGEIKSFPAPEPEKKQATSIPTGSPNPVAMQPAKSVSGKAPQQVATALPPRETLASVHVAQLPVIAIEPPQRPVAKPAPLIPEKTQAVAGESSNPPVAKTVEVARVALPPPAPVVVAEPQAASAAPPLMAKVEEAAPEIAIQPSDATQETVFRVKYVADGVAYLDGGRGAGLAEGMKLEVRDKNNDRQVVQGTSVDPADPRVVAELVITGLADTSSVTDIHSPKRQVKAGDLAYLSSGDSQALSDQKTLSATRQYPAIVTFTEGDPLEEEVRDAIPHPPSPAVNRMRGRFGFDYIGTMNHEGSGSTSSNLGVVVRTDMTRIAGTHWNLSGYWRGRLNSQSASSQQTVQDLINRTYHLSMTYDNPDSAWVAGFGRLYLPYAPSLETLDGGYVGRKVSDTATVGLFAGSTPDPSSWSYNPDQKLTGAFVNFEGGTYENLRYSSTSGVGLGLLKWASNKPFVFFENSIFFKRYFSIYHSLQADNPKGNPAVPTPGAGISRSFFTLRVQPLPRLELDFNHNYLRDIPTYDPQLIGTGLLDKYLFQGFSAGARVEVIKTVTLYGELGRSNRTGDTKMSLNQMYGITFARLPRFGLRADAHYSKFDSAFGSGSYRSISVSRNINDAMRLEILGGDQSFASSLSNNDTSRFVNVNFESNFGRNYFFQGGFSVNRGNTQSYDQWMMTLGYRFDSKTRKAR